MSIPKILYLGPPHSFHHLTAKCIFGEEASYHPVSTPEDIGSMLETSAYDYGVIAIENVLAGRVPDHLEVIVNHKLNVIKQVITEVQLYICGLPSMSIDQIKTIYSHPMALQQCSNYLDKKGWKQNATSSTSEALYQISIGNSQNEAAIGNKQAANEFNLQVIDGPANNELENHTRFLVVARKSDLSFRATSECEFASLLYKGETKASLNLEALGMELINDWQLKGQVGIWLECRLTSNYNRQQAFVSDDKLQLIGFYEKAYKCADY